MKLSFAEHEFICQGVDQDFRSDGRSRTDYRAMKVETGVISQANGSCRLKIGATEILVGVKADIQQPDPLEPESGKLFFSVECSASAAPEFEGRGGEELNLELTTCLERIINKYINLNSLCIIPNEIVWALYIDAMILDTDGNLYDALSLSTRCALFNAKLPSVNVIENEEGPNDYELSDDPLEVKRLDVERIPISLTFTKISNFFIIDSTLEEESCMQGRVTIAINKQGNICSIQQGSRGRGIYGGTDQFGDGSSGINPSSIPDLIMLAQTVGVKLIEKMDKILKTEQEELESGQRRTLGFFAD